MNLVDMILISYIDLENGGGKKNGKKILKTRAK